MNGSTEVCRESAGCPGGCRHCRTVNTHVLAAAQGNGRQRYLSPAVAHRDLAFKMSDGYSARRGEQTAGTQSAPGRPRLGKREWQDIRRACKLGVDGELHAVDLHGVRLTFRFQRACSGPAQDMASPSSRQDGQAAGRRSTTAQRPPTTPTGPSDDQRNRKSKGKQGSMRTHKHGKACTTAGEDAGRARAEHRPERPQVPA